MPTTNELLDIQKEDLHEEVFLVRDLFQGYESSLI